MNPIIIPQPQHEGWQPGPRLALPHQIILPADASSITQLAAARLAATLATTTGQPVQVGNIAASHAAFHLEIDPGLRRAESYRIYDEGQHVFLLGADEPGLSHAVETARQLITKAGWPRCRIDDWPDYAWRGVFVESFWGADLMTLADWQTFIDELVRRKLNTLHVDLYNCWEIKYNGVPTEFLMAPLHHYPQLQTPQVVRYIDPNTLAWTEKRYLPTAFVEDLLLQVFAYARAHGLRIVPHFGGPGHNTLIPRLFPELSARKPDGDPTFYGYCLSQPATWTFLRNVVEELVERYCQPFGVTHFHLAADEVYPLRNILPDDPNAEASPWCACADCQALSPFDQLCRYLFGMAGLLAKHQIRAIVCADSIERLDGMAEFKRRVAAQDAGKQFVVQWWCYKEPLPKPTSAPELETWVMPSTGLVGNLLYQDFSRNIYGFLQLGRAAGATGVTAYNVPDRRLDKNYACLAEFSWNTGSGSIPHFHIRYAQQTYGAGWRTALEAYDVAERIMGCHPVACYIMDQLLHYFNTYPPGRVDYPLDMLRTLAGDPLALLAGIRQIADHMASAEALLARLESLDNRGDHFTLECRRYRTLAQAVLAVVESVRLVSAAQDAAAGGHQEDAHTCLAQAVNGAQQARAALRDTMLEMMRLQAAYLLPGSLREVSPLFDFLNQIAGQIGQALVAVHNDPLYDLRQITLAQAFDLGKLRAVWHPWEF